MGDFDECVQPLHNSMDKGGEAARLLFLIIAIGSTRDPCIPCRYDYLEKALEQKENGAAANGDFRHRSRREDPRERERPRDRDRKRSRSRNREGDRNRDRYRRQSPSARPRRPDPREHRRRRDEVRPRRHTPMREARCERIACASAL